MLFSRHKRFIGFAQRLLPLFCILTFTCAPDSICAQPQTSNALVTAARAANLAVFDDVWITIKDRYYDPSLHDVDWQGLRQTFRPLAADARSTSDLYATLRRMLARLRDSHTRLYAPDETFDRDRPHVWTTGLSLREVDGVPLVWRVARGSSAERERVRAGDIIVSVGGESASDLLERRSAENQGASRRETRRFQAVTRLLDGGVDDSIITINFLRPDGRAYTAQLQRLRQERPLPLVVRTARRGIVVIRLNAFTGSTAADFGRLLKNLTTARGIVFDLRDNAGGESEAMLDVLSAFLPPNSLIGRFTDRNGRIATELQTRTAMLSAAARITSLPQPVVVLTSPKTASAAEIFAAALRERGRARVLGENTCGCVLGTRGAHKLPDEGKLVFSEMDYHTTLGTRLEGAGVSPDETIKLSRRDLQAKTDSLLERAVEILGQR